MFYFGVGRGTGGFNFSGGERPFFFLGNALFDGMGGMGRTEYQKCPLKIFILCEYIDKVYTYIYM